MNINILTADQYGTWAVVGAVEIENNSTLFQYKVKWSGRKTKKQSRKQKVILVADYNSFLAAFGNVCTAVIVFLAVPVITSASAVSSFSALKAGSIERLQLMNPWRIVTGPGCCFF